MQLKLHGIALQLFSVVLIHINAKQHNLGFYDSSLIVYANQIQVTSKLHQIIALKVRSKSDPSSVNLALVYSTVEQCKTFTEIYKMYSGQSES